MSDLNHNISHWRRGEIVSTELESVGIMDKGEEGVQCLKSWYNPNLILKHALFPPSFPFLESVMQLVCYKIVDLKQKQQKKTQEIEGLDLDYFVRELAVCSFSSLNTPTWFSSHTSFPQPTLHILSRPTGTTIVSYLSYQDPFI